MEIQRESRIASTAAVANGIVYFGAYDGNFYALDAASGVLKWKFATEGEHRFAANASARLAAGEGSDAGSV